MAELTTLLRGPQLIGRVPLLQVPQTMDAQCLQHLPVDMQCLREWVRGCLRHRSLCSGLIAKASRSTASLCPGGGPGQWRFYERFHSLLIVATSFQRRPGFSHYGPVGPEWTRHAERWQAAVPPYLLEGQEWLERSQRSSFGCFRVMDITFHTTPQKINGHAPPTQNREVPRSRLARAVR